MSYDLERKILDHLIMSDGYVSGEDLSTILGISRAYVWKHIKKLREYGYSIDAHTNMGYRLVNSPDRLFPGEIERGLNTSYIGRKGIQYHDTLSSTNDEAYALAEQDAPEGTIVIAEKQRSGKGRMGRTWVSPAYKGIYISIILRPGADLESIPFITLIVANAVTDVLEDNSGLKFGVKWPNDIVYNDKKICGILVEMKAQTDKVDFIILGIGININTPASMMPAKSTSLKEETGKFFVRSKILTDLLGSIERYYDRFNAGDMARLRQECIERSVTLGKYITIRGLRDNVSGEASGIDDKGALLVKGNDGALRRVFSGDVEYGFSGKK